ncbi:MAG TPA: hypothetical protein VIV06_01890, partial [Candidatus Limnocylindrales bacterium]
MTIAVGPDGPATGRRRARPSLIREIAARRLADVTAELAGRSYRELARLATAAPPARPVALRLAAPGLHVIAEVKRSSPSAGPIARESEDVVRRASQYAEGGAAAISVLCERHWFGGSVDDLRAVRAAVGVPVLAKDFIVDARQLPLLRAAGADAVLLLASLHPRRRLERLVRRALDLGLEPLVEAHDERELERTLEASARLIGLNNRDLRSLEVDPEQAVRLRALVPDDRIVVAESGVRDARTIAAWRAIGFDAALVGETFMRAADPAAAVRSFVAAGRVPSDPANLGRLAAVKICGIVDAGGALAAIAADADAIGLNLVPGTPRALTLAEATRLATFVRSATADRRRPRVVAVTVDLAADELRRLIAALDPDVVQLSGSEPLEVASALERPFWKAIHLPATIPDGDAAAGDAAAGNAAFDAAAGDAAFDAAHAHHAGLARGLVLAGLEHV